MKNSSIVIKAVAAAFGIIIVGAISSARVEAGAVKTVVVPPQTIEMTNPVDPEGPKLIYQLVEPNGVSESLRNGQASDLQTQSGANAKKMVTTIQSDPRTYGTGGAH